jgi:hypothetical protein
LLKGILVNGTLVEVNPASGVHLITPDRMRKLPQNTRYDAQRYLNRMRDQGSIIVEYLPLPRSSTFDDEGLKEAVLRTCAVIGFDGIVVSLNAVPEELRDNLRWVRLTKLLESEQWQVTRRRTQAVFQNRSEYVKLLPGVLRHVSEVILIDPHLNCDQDKCWNLLKVIEEILHARPTSSRGATITIHTETLSDNSDVVRQAAVSWERKLKPLVDELHIKGFVVNFWRRADGSDRRMHDRYIITERVGFIVPNGLECYSSGGNTTVWALMEPDDRDKVLAEYRNDGQPFKLVHTLRIPDPL